MSGRRGRRRKKLLYDLKELREYWELKKETLDNALWRTRFGRGCGTYRKAEKKHEVIQTKSRDATNNIITYLHQNLNLNGN